MTALDVAAAGWAPGDLTGVAVPAHSEALGAGGEAFLTEAFRAFGALSPDNRVAKITRFEPCAGGSTGQKLFLSVAYEKSEPHLHADLFVKFSRDFADPIRDARGKHEMEGEVRLAALSRAPAFPVKTPKAYFADYHHASHTGVLITEQIVFGEGGVEPHRPKCRDHELADPLGHYRAIMKSLARLAAAHRSGRLAAEVETRFPFDADAAAARNRVPYDEGELRARVAQFADFAASCPQLFPAAVVAPSVFASLDREVGRFAQHQARIGRFHQGDPDFIALCHWNANIDNAWFWRDAQGELQCGLMDWGHAGQINLAFALWGCLCAAGLQTWDRDLPELLDLFTGELAAQGGPRLSVAELRLHLDLYVAMMGLSYFLDSPARILFRMPEVVRASGPRDPALQANETVRNQLHISTVFLNLWRTHDIPASLDRLLQR